MKYSWLSLSVAAGILTGCSSLMYGGGVAPVSNGNTYYRQPGNYQPVDQTPQIQQNSTQAVQQAYQPPVIPRSSVPQNINRAQVPVQQPVQAQYPSPYVPPQTEPPQRKTVSADDGWSVKPNNQPQINDIPKTAPQNQPSADNTAEQTVEAAAPKRETPKAIRPPSREEQQAVQEEQRVQKQPEQTKEQTQQQEPERKVASNAPANVSGSGNAVSTLLKKANGELTKGNLDGAAAYLQDAQRIDSRNPKILYDIANIRYHQGKYREAEAAASRAVNLGGSAAMQKKSWSLIANSRKQLGDNQGAIQAANKASSF